jgi:hypothetical protein
MTRRAALAPARLACCVSSIASAVEFEPVPAMTGTRPETAAMQSSTTRLCSSWLRVGDSPVVPHGTSPFMPSATCHSTSFLKALSSTAPFRNGVTRAVIEPLNMTMSANLLAVRGGATHDPGT